MAVEERTCGLCDGERTSGVSDAIPCPHCRGTGTEPYEELGNATMVRTDYIRASMPLSMLLGQDEVWHPKGSEPIRLVDMGSRHRRNTLRLLRRKAARLAFAVVMETVGGPLAARGDMASMDQDRWCDEVMDDPAAWLETEPLVKKLAALVAADEARAHQAATRPRTPEEMF